METLTDEQLGGILQRAEAGQIIDAAEIRILIRQIRHLKKDAETPGLPQGCCARGQHNG